MYFPKNELSKIIGAHEKCEVGTLICQGKNHINIVKIRYEMIRELKKILNSFILRDKVESTYILYNNSLSIQELLKILN